MKQQRTEFFLALTLIAIGVAMRFLPHPANVAPIAAVALFSGVYLKRWYAFAVPLVAMVASDAVIGFHSTIAFTWGSFLLAGVIGWRIRRRKNASTIVLGSLGASVLFYLITNFGVWAMTPLYAKTGAGLWQSYIMAVPFFRNTLLGDLLYTGALFGLYEAVALVIRRRQTIPLPS